MAGRSLQSAHYLDNGIQVCPTFAVLPESLAGAQTVTGSSQLQAEPRASWLRTPQKTSSPPRRSPPGQLRSHLPTPDAEWQICWNLHHLRWRTPVRTRWDQGHGQGYQCFAEDERLALSEISCDPWDDERSWSAKVKFEQTVDELVLLQSANRLRRASAKLGTRRDQPQHWHEHKMARGMRNG